MRFTHAFLRAASFGLMLFGLRFTEVHAATKWIHLRSANLEAISDASEEDARSRLIVMERFRGVLPKGLFGRPVSGMPTRVLMLKDGRMVNRMISGERPGRKVRAEGAYIADKDENLIVLNLVGDIHHRGLISQHEFVHLLMRNESTGWPVWLQEGIALSFEHVEFRDGNAIFGLPRTGFVHSFRASALFPWEDFLRMDRRQVMSMKQERALLYYAQSWLLTHFLLFGQPPARRASLDLFFDLVDRRIPSVEAIHQAFGWKPEDLKNEVKKYMRHGRFDTQAAEVPRELDLGVQSAEAPAGLGEAWIACFEAQSGRLDEGRKWLEAARQAGGETAWTVLVEGELALEAEDRLAAAAKFRRAVQLDPDLVKARMALVESLSDDLSTASREAIEEIDVQLGRVVEKAPNHDVAWGMLGICQLRLERPEYAAKSFAESLKRNPRNWVSRYHLAVLRSRVGLKDLALSRLKEVAERCGDPRLAELARKRIAEIGELERKEGR